MEEVNELFSLLRRQELAVSPLSHGTRIEAICGLTDR
jgi:hypothetical protein